MSNYKLIKEYPGSPKLATVIQQQEGSGKYFYGGLQIENPSNYPDYWVKVVDQSPLIWEIVKVEAPSGAIITYNKGICTARSDDFPITSTLTLDRALCKGDKILAVKRLSDGVVFNVGDEVEYQTAGTWNKKSRSKITKFRIESGQCTISTLSCLDFAHLSDTVRIIPSFYLKTHDGVEITSPTQGHYSVNKNTLRLADEGGPQYSGSASSPELWLTFSTYKKAYDYIVNNQRLFSLEEIRSRFLNDLEVLAKQRVNVK